MLQNDTIAAIATGISEAGIGIIRISGPDALKVADRVVIGRGTAKKPSAWKSHTIHIADIVDPAHQNEVMDEAMVSVMLAPKTYTTEDTVEINTHGGVYLMQKILKLILQEGCRLAEPGEFTKRAFLGGRIDLSKAEAVMDLIGSQNEFSRKTSLAQLEGSVSGRVREIREKVLYEIAFIESALDDPENYSLDGYPDRLRKTCCDLIEELNSMLSFAENGRILKEGIRCVIVGKPNAGKSSLLNMLSGHDRAIVTEIAGTTRDTLEETVRLGDVVLRLTDTAGIHDTEDVVEQIGVEKAKGALEEADLILFLLDGSTDITEEDRQIAAMISKKVAEGVRCIVLLNKSDLPHRVHNEDAEKLFELFRTTPPVSRESGKVINYKKIDYISISAAKGFGVELLQDHISQMFRTGDLITSNEVFLSNVRQKSDATAARNALQLVVNSIDQNMSEDFFSIDLMNAYTSLGHIVGEEVEDDLVEEIFTKFCLGK